MICNTWTSFENCHIVSIEDFFDKISQQWPYHARLGVICLNLSKNHISELPSDFITKLLNIFPNIKMVDLSRNGLKTYDELMMLLSHQQIEMVSIRFNYIKYMDTFLNNLGDAQLEKLLWIPFADHYVNNKKLARYIHPSKNNIIINTHAHHTHMFVH